MPIDDKKAAKMLLSISYRKILAKPMSQKDSQDLGVEEGTPWSDAIASQVVRRAVGLVPDEKICFKAITELRETTEGKTPEKIITAGANEELANLTRILNQPAPDEPESSESESFDSEVDFHSSNSEE